MIRLGPRPEHADLANRIGDLGFLDRHVQRPAVAGDVDDDPMRLGAMGR
jgi:hypothetical protein